MLDGLTASRIDASGSVPLDSAWVGARRYKLRGRTVVPDQASGFTAEDLFTGYVRNAGRGKLLDQPYLELLHLATRLDEPASALDRFPESRRRANRSFGDYVKELYIGGPDNEVLAFVNKNGLLGVLPASYRSIQIGAGNKWLTLHRGPTWWREWSSKRVGPAESWGEVGRFFPDLQSPEQVPLPGTQEFFRTYAEPAERIADAAKAFRDIARLIGKRSVPTEDDLPTLQLLRLWTECPMGLEADASGPDWSRPPLRCVVPSRLSSYTIMLLWDVAAGRVVDTCPRCGTWMVLKEREAAEFCSRTCKDRQSAAERYERLKAEQENA